MKTTMSKAALPLLAVGFIPLIGLTTPFAAHAQTTTHLSDAQTKVLEQEKTAVMKDDAQLSHDQDQLYRDKMSRLSMEEDAYTGFEFGDSHEGYRFEYRDIYHDPEYRAIMSNIEEDNEAVRRDNERLHYDANVYRGQLHNDGLHVPSQLPFVSEPA